METGRCYQHLQMQYSVLTRWVINGRGYMRALSTGWFEDVAVCMLGAGCCQQKGLRALQEHVSPFFQFELLFPKVIKGESVLCAPPSKKKGSPQAICHIKLSDRLYLRMSAQIEEPILHSQINDRHWQRLHCSGRCFDVAVLRAIECHKWLIQTTVNILQNRLSRSEFRGEF